MKYDYLVVGSGLYGAVFAREAVKAGKSVSTKLLMVLIPIIAIDIIIIMVVVATQAKGIITDLAMNNLQKESNFYAEEIGREITNLQEYLDAQADAARAFRRIRSRHGAHPETDVFGVCLSEHLWKSDKIFPCLRHTLEEVSHPSIWSSDQICHPLW